MSFRQRENFWLVRFPSHNELAEQLRPGLAPQRRQHVFAQVRRHRRAVVPVQILREVVGRALRAQIIADSVDLHKLLVVERPGLGVKVSLELVHENVHGLGQCERRFGRLGDGAGLGGTCY